MNKPSSYNDVGISRSSTHRKLRVTKTIISMTMTGTMVAATMTAVMLLFSSSTFSGVFEPVPRQDITITIIIIG